MADNTIGWPTIVTAAVALYGAVLSTVNFLIARKERRRQVKVRLLQALAVPRASPSVKLLRMAAVNVGTRPVTLDAPVILLPTGDQVCFPRFAGGTTADFPCELTDSAKCEVHIEVGWLANAYRQMKLTGKAKLVAAFTDSTGKVYRSKPLTIHAKTVFEEERLL